MDAIINWIVSNHNRIFVVLALCALIVGQMDSPS